MDTKKRRGVLMRALMAAREASETWKNEPDGGSCNFDSLAVRAKGMREDDFAYVARMAGVSARKVSWMGSGWFMVDCGYGGQAYRRTKQAEAATRAFLAIEGLKDVGLDATTYYRVD